MGEERLLRGRIYGVGITAKQMIRERRSWLWRARRWHPALRSDRCSIWLTRLEWRVLGSTDTTEMRVGNTAAQDATRGWSFWRHWKTDLPVCYSCLSVGRFQPLLALEKMLCLAGDVECSKVTAMQATRSHALLSRVSIENEAGILKERCSL